MIFGLQRKTFLLVFIASFFTCLAIYVPREQFIVLFSIILIAFLFYAFLPKSKLSIKTILLFAILARLMLFAQFPNLSDDVYRFIWDGQLIKENINPYAFTPEQIHEKIGDEDLFRNLNSKRYYSVYPPIMQAVFAMSALSGKEDLQKVIFLRLILLLSEIGILLLLSRILRILKSNETWLCIYAFNPLVIIEVIGNLHFESMMICFFLLGFYVLMQARKNWIQIILASIFFACGICTKMSLGLILPVLLFFIPFKRLVPLAILTLFFVMLLFLPFYDYTLVQNILQSLDLYFRSFEFNASLFYLFNWIGKMIKGWDTVQFVGPLLSAFSLVLILILCVFKKKKNWQSYFDYAQLAFFIYLLCSTTIHPWYVLNLVFLSVFTQKIYPIVWSLTVGLSYYMYSNNLNEPVGLLVLEYVLVFIVFLAEQIQKKWIIQFKKNVPLFQVDGDQE